MMRLSQNLLVKVFLLSFVLVLELVYPQKVSATNEIRYIDLVEVSWNNSNPLSTSVDQLAINIQETVKPAWIRMTNVVKQEVDRSIEFEVGLVSSKTIRLQKPIPCEGPEFLSVLNSIRSFFYSNTILKNTEKRHLLVLMPKSGCIWMGKATSGGTDYGGGVLVLQDTADPFVLSHELGHNLGLGHSNYLKCETGKSDGLWSEDCRAFEYGGAIDVMGNVKTDSLLSTYHQWRLGLIPDLKIHQSWISEEVKLSASDVDSNVRAIFIRDKDSTYWIEYRRPTVGLGYRPGIVILRTDPPPLKYVVSPNSPVTVDSIQNSSVTSDYWMLNLDNYIYSQTGKYAGSMTLPKTSIFTSATGRFKISAEMEVDTDSVTVKIVQQPDSTPPEIPFMRPQQTWSTGNDFVVNYNYGDGETIVVGFEGKINDKVFSISGSSRYLSGESYKDPLLAEKTLRVSDLPEGKYDLQIRSIDVYGNRSGWSSKAAINLDNTPPALRSKSSILQYDQGKIKLSLDEVFDSGSGICMTTLSNEDGFIFHSSRAIKNPSFMLEKKQNISFKVSSLDCAGNESTANFKFSYKEIQLDKLKRTGNWRPISKNGVQGIKCISRCTASITLKQDTFLVSDQGNSNLSSSNIIELRPTVGNEDSLSIVPINVVKTARKTIRISGSKFSIFALSQIDLEFQNIQVSKASKKTKDQTLSILEQNLLSKVGFQETDFDADWQVTPMNRGTGLQDPTLDLCAKKYDSENKRVSRRQVIVTKNISPYLFLSSEVVRYKDLDSASQAYLELSTKLKECLSARGWIDESGLFVEQVFSEFPTHPLLNSNKTKKVFVRTTIGAGSESRSLIGLYQFNKEMLSSIYVLKAGSNSFSDEEVLRWLNVAGIIETRLTS